MEMFQELREKALKSIKIADHMLGVSYPLLNDPKILVSVANNLLLAVDYSLSSVLEHEKLFKRIQNYPVLVDAKYLIVKQKALKGVHDKKYDVINYIMEVVKSHKKSLIEFPRQDKLVIA